MLRFNERTLLTLATQKPDKEGFLLKRGERSFQGLVRRYFILKNNFLFFFKDKEPLREPIGCIVLERMAVVPQQNPVEFTLEFDCPESRILELFVEKPEERAGWMTAIKEASYEYQLEQLLKLDNRLTQLIGKSSLENTHFLKRPLTSSESRSLSARRQTELTKTSERGQVRSMVRSMSVPSRDGKSHSRQSSADFNRLLGSSIYGGDPTQLENNPFINAKLLAVQLALENMVLPEDVSSVRVLVQQERAHGEFDEVFHTETQKIDGEKVAFETAANLSLLAPSTPLRFVVQSVRDGDDSQARELCAASYRASAISNNISLPLASLGGTTDLCGTLRMKCEGEESPAPVVARADAIEAILPYPLQTTNGETIVITERLHESQYLLPLTVKLVNHFLKRDRTLLRRLEDIGPLLGAAECARQQQFDFGMARIQTLTQHLAFLDNFEETFKRSVTKKDREVELLTTNLHIHSLSVAAEGGKEIANYQVVTCGAATAHALGYKHGGLSRMFFEHFKALRGGDLLSPCEKALRSIINTVKNLQLELDELKRVMSRPDFAQLARTFPERITARLDPLLKTIGHSIVTIALQRLAASRPGDGDVDTSPTDQTDPSQTQAKLQASITNTRDELLAALHGITEEPSSLAAVDAAASLLRKAARLAGAEVQECLLVARLQIEGSAAEVEDITYRRDVVFSQVLPPLVTSFIASLRANASKEIYFRQMLEVGFLFHIESLLSTYGDELHMLEDMDAGISELQRVEFELVPASAKGMVPFSVDFITNDTAWIVPYNLKLKVYVPDDVYAICAGHRAHVTVCPVLLTQGVNEMQSIANGLGEAVLQETINERNYEKMKEYLHRFTQFIRQRGDSNQTESNIQHLQWAFEKTLAQKRTKNVEFFTLSEKLVREVNGGRVTCCKSGKDRTAMAVTLEECNLLMSHHNMQPTALQETLDWLRSSGVRRENVYRNIQEDKYAFNMLQIYALPTLLRPPEGTYGSTKT